METSFDISLVVSSFNRENKVKQTIDSILANDLTPFKAVELIVIDDGSPVPIAPLIPSPENIPAPIHLRFLTQENSGIGATRNRGFREAKADLVFFLDDDIILEKDTILKMYQADKEHPGAVIFGNYPFISHNTESLHQFAKHLFNYDRISAETHFEKVDAISSGLLLVDKKRLGYPQQFYRDDMTVPAAEEHEVIARFHRTGIPIYIANHIYTKHNHHLELKWLANQQYKYGLATAEAFIKRPEILEMPKFLQLKHNLEKSSIINFKNIIKSIFSSSLGKTTLLKLTQGIEWLFPNFNHNIIFGLLTSCYFKAGYNDGIKKFSKKLKN